MDPYGPLLAKVWFPSFEPAWGRPTVPLLRYLQATERWSIEALRDLQLGLLRRLVRHAYQHTTYFREVIRRSRPNVRAKAAPDRDRQSPEHRRTARTAVDLLSAQALIIGE